MTGKAAADRMIRSMSLLEQAHEVLLGIHYALRNEGPLSATAAAVVEALAQDHTDQLARLTVMIQMVQEAAGCAKRGS